MSHKCPQCGTHFDKFVGLAMHCNRSNDHKSLDESYEYTTNNTDNESNKEDYELPSWNISENSDSNNKEVSSRQCCSNPEIVGSKGDVFKLQSGEHLRLESNEQICKNCERIHEQK